MTVRFKDPYSYRMLFGDIYFFLRPYRARFWFATALRLSTDLAFLYVSYALSVVIAWFAWYRPGMPLDGFWHALAWWALAYAYVHTARQVAKYYCYNVAEQANLDAQRAAMAHMSALDIAWHEKENTGNKLKRAMNGGEGIEKLLRIWVDNLIEIAVNFIGMTIIVAFVDLRVGALLLGFLASYVLIALPLSRRSAHASRIVSSLEEDFSGLAFETIGNVRSVKVMGFFPALARGLEERARAIARAIRHRILCFRSQSAIQSMWAHAFRIVCFIVIAYGIASGRYDLAFLIMFNFYFTNMRTSAEELSSISQDLTVSRHYVERLSALFKTPVGIDRMDGKRDFPDNWRVLSLRNVSFAYGETPVLDRVSFDIRRGEKVGIVGLSGAGKSTIFKLLLKEYEHFTGDILVEGVSLRDIGKESYFRRVAVVLQDTEVFNMPLADNITLSNPDAPDREARLSAAVETAHVTDFLQKLPDGLETVIGEKGIRLSGGEKQRVGIARAVYKRPEILLLDEATSHLDVESEEKIKDSLHRFFQNVTAVVIAHRLTTIQEMDRILLIENGALIESGDFRSLMDAKGRFFDLWQKQRL